jgi:two-component system LytT family response regulator
VIKTLIVDDEPLARRRLRSLLTRETDIRLIGECGDGPSAVEVIERQRPDLLFLDVQMPEMDGFDVLRRLGDDVELAVVFVTAYDQFTLRAFEVHALDYLLKPFHRSRFQETLRLVRRRLADARELAAARAGMSALLMQGAEPSPSPCLERITIKSAGKVRIVATDEIDWIEGDGNYARLHLGAKVHLLRSTMKALAEQLDPQTFVRIHHSRIVNIRRVRELRPWAHGDFVVLLDGGQRLTSSRSYSANLRRVFAL